jgi:acetyltransferase
VAGVLAYRDIASLPVTPDLALVCCPAAAVPAAIRDLGARGTRAACVMTGALHLATDEQGRNAFEAARTEARAFGLRILGPNSMGILVPGIGLNASLAPGNAAPGKIAFVSQSGALCSAVIDWAGNRRIGFSHFIHTGDGADVEIGQILDYLGSEPSSRAILLYIENVDSRQKFMSAARAAARNKPVLVIKAGRTAEGARAAAAHHGTTASSDAVFDAAIRRAGMLRVRDIDEIFGAVETLARARPVKGNRLAILTNGGGFGVMATDDLCEGGGRMAVLPDEVVAKIDARIPPNWSRRNPVDIAGDADGPRYAAALEALVESKQVDAVLAMHAPTAISNPTEVAEAVIKVVKEHPRANIMACWVGSQKVGDARRLFAEAGVPGFDTPRAAVEGFLHLLEYRRNQDMLMEVPASSAAEFIPDVRYARELVREAMARGESVLSEPAAKALLEAYGIPVIDTRFARNPAEASRTAKDFPGRVALKVVSPSLVHKSEAGGVILDLSGPFEVEKAANAMLEKVRAACPDARIDGFTVQPMAERKPGTQELFVGVATDPVFGPYIKFGQGGAAVEVIGDYAVALPPLNTVLAADLVERTRVSRLLKSYRDRPAADVQAIYLTLIQVSQMVVDIPELAEMDINPLWASPEGVVALDARIRLEPAPPATERLSIRPYPAEYEEWFTMTDGRRVLLRPIRPEDEPNHHVFISKLTPEDIRFRFFGLVHQLPHSEMARLTQIDYRREMAFIAEIDAPGGGKETLGVVRTVTDPDNEKAEFAIVVRSDIKSSGLGRRLLSKMIGYCRANGTHFIIGQVLRDNGRMLRFIDHLGFRPVRTVEDDVVEVELDLSVEPPELTDEIARG